MTTITATEFTVILENYDGRCKRAKVIAVVENDAWTIAAMKFPSWVVVGIDHAKTRIITAVCG